MLEILNISKKFVNSSSPFSQVPMAVDNLSLNIAEGEFFSLLGPSGCGKTTLLRMIAGLDFPTSGEIRFAGERIDQWPAQKRPFNMVFQRYALFPHLSVFENVAFGLRLKKRPTEEIKQRVGEALELVNMSGFASRLPETLSGGQSQRVAIARALVNKPQILLLDEPLSALDQKLREHMQSELKQLQQSLGLTFIYVTHDQEEALALSDRIGVMNMGRLEQVSEPESLYDEPETLFAAQFVGPSNTLNVELVGVQGEYVRGQADSFSVLARPKQLHSMSSGTPALALVRPEKLQLILEDVNSKPEEMNYIQGAVRQIIFRGTQTELIVQTPTGVVVRAYISAQRKRIQVGSTVGLAFAPEDTFMFMGE